MTTSEHIAPVDTARPAIAGVITDALDALAAAPAGHRAVADRLTLARATGVRGDKWACPVARYLSGRTGPDVLAVTVGRSLARVHTAAGPVYTLILPYPVRQFVAAFDAGVYRSLQETRHG